LNEFNILLDMASASFYSEHVQLGELAMSEPDVNKNRSRYALGFMILAIAVACLAYRILVTKQLEQTALLFVGIPTILAVIVAFTPRAKTTTGGIFKATTIGLLLSAPLLGEGFICILMASPIFFLVAGIIALVRKTEKVTLSCVVFVAFIPMSLEGVRPGLSFNREETVTVIRIVNASSSEVESALRRAPRTDLPLPFYLRLGFPRPTQAQGGGLQPGDLRSIHFAGGEGHPGDLVMRVDEAGPGHVRFVAIADKSKVAHWLRWDSAEVNWKAVDATHTQVSWTLHFRRLLDPAWYFRPFERYAVGLAADYLIQANATPAENQSWTAR
jgi:hypothetical protein